MILQDSGWNVLCMHCVRHGLKSEPCHSSEVSRLEDAS
jgi:hypothetical protein